MTDAATISRSVGQLIKLNYVEKVKCERDGRVFFVKLTKKGAGLVPELNKVHRELAERCFSSLRSEEKRQLAALLREVVGHLDEVHGKTETNLRSS
jgi:DNA-binding MarR family transcriptional regulator